jgi:hypothetical protein
MLSRSLFFDLMPPQKSIAVFRLKIYQQFRAGFHLSMLRAEVRYNNLLLEVASVLKDGQYEKTIALPV